MTYSRKIKLAVIISIMLIILALTQFYGTISVRNYIFSKNGYISSNNSDIRDAKECLGNTIFTKPKLSYPRYYVSKGMGIMPFITSHKVLVMSNPNLGKKTNEIHLWLFGINIYIMSINNTVHVQQLVSVAEHAE